jgi:hypothetical protein
VLDQELFLTVVGWGQAGCVAYVAERAVQFDFSVLNQIRSKTIDRVVLRYNEAIGPDRPIAPGEISGWSDGDGRPEVKPDGCVVVRVPANDRIDGQVPDGMLATQNNGALVPRISVHEWDVTQPMSWQIDPSTIPLTPPGGTASGRGFGLVLAGLPSLNQLTGDD